MEPQRGQGVVLHRVSGREDAISSPLFQILGGEIPVLKRQIYERKKANLSLVTYRRPVDVE